MSTEHQRYSIEYQSANNAAYALEHGCQIVRSYTDAGVSGLSMKRREGLRRLLADVVSGEADFELILVYDVSRWGRFQDPDQAAHYEFLCREAGVRVEYTAEPFENDGSLTTTIVKHLKRAMAAEYSRELSVKVATAQRGLALKGYWRGSASGFGFRRCEVRPDGAHGRIMDAGERKALQGHRTVLVLGPHEEVKTVRRIFSEFTVHGLSTREIARGLRTDGAPIGTGGPWSPGRVRRILHDEKYAGTVVSGRFRSRLRTPSPAPRSAWVRVAGACPAIVSRATFETAQRNLSRAPAGPSDEELLAQLRRLLAEHGRLSAGIIAQDRDAYCPTLFYKRFGGLTLAYRLAGYEPSRHQKAAAAWSTHRDGAPHPHAGHVYATDAIVAGLKRLFQEHGRISSDLIETSPGLPGATTCRTRLGGMAAIYALVGYAPTERQRRHLGPPGPRD